MVGQPYGCKLHSRNRKGFVYLLKPTPELWTISLPHRTQILYAPDMAFIVMKLNLSPGATVIESGTGSGSFTHTLARTVARGPPAGDGVGQLPATWNGAGASPDYAPGAYDGRVYSFEFHAERVEKARAEFSEHGLDKTVVLAHRNVCKDGFGLTHAADAAFLDLPAPWEAVPFAKESLRSDVVTRICCFSPCIEQVLRTVAALSDHGFSDVSTYESLIRTHESLTNVAPLEPISDVVDRIRDNERRREGRREMQMANSRMEREKREALKKEGKEAQGGGEGKDEVQEKAAEAEAKASNDSAQHESEPHELADVSMHADTDAERPVDEPAKRTADDIEQPAKRKADDTDEPAKRTADDTDEPATKRRTQPADDGPAEPPAEMLYSAGFRQRLELRPLTPTNVYSRPFPQMRGHTSYLTFATLLPRT